MNILLAYLLTVGASYVMEVSLAKNVFKSLADNGYKMDIGELKRLAVILGNESSKYFKFLPFFNMFYEMHLLNDFHNNYNELFTALDTNGCIYEMTEEEKKEYAKHPNGFNAFKISLKSYNKKIEDEQVTTIIVHHNAEDDSIFRFNFKDSDINILSSSGYLSNADKDKQQDTILRVTLLTSNGLEDKNFVKEHGINIGGTRDTMIIELNDTVFNTPEMREIDKVVDAINAANKEAEENDSEIAFLKGEDLERYIRLTEEVKEEKPKVKTLRYNKKN